MASHLGGPVKDGGRENTQVGREGGGDRREGEHTGRERRGRR